MGKTIKNFKSKLVDVKISSKENLKLYNDLDVNVWS